jgi:hypothetical protein
MDDSTLIYRLAELLEIPYDPFVLALCEPLPNKTFSPFAGKLFRHHLKSNHPIASAAVTHPKLQDLTLKLLILSQVAEEDLAHFAQSCGVTPSALLDWSIGHDASFDFETNRTYEFHEGAKHFSKASADLQKIMLLNRALAPLATRLLLNKRALLSS